MRDRTILVTDAIAAAGCAPGRYAIGGVECELGDDGRVSLPGTPYLAGSSLTLDRAIANTVRFTGLPIDDVMPMASTIPAAYLGHDDRRHRHRRVGRRSALRCCTIRRSTLTSDDERSRSLDWAVLVALSHRHHRPSASSSAIASATAASTFSAGGSSARG